MWAETAIAALAQIVARCPAQPRHYLGITVSAIRIPFVLLDADQRVVGPSLLNRDRRALPIVDDLVASIGHRRLHSTTGHWAAPEFGLPKLLWIQRTYPAAWQQVRTIIQLHDWFIFSLCGAIASEASSAAMSQMMDISAGTWAYDLLASECGVRGEMMPEFAAAGTRAGGLLRAVAEQVGLPAGLPVHLGVRAIRTCPHSPPGARRRVARSWSPAPPGQPSFRSSLPPISRPGSRFSSVPCPERRAGPSKQTQARPGRSSTGSMT